MKKNIIILSIELGVMAGKPRYIFKIIQSLPKNINYSLISNKLNKQLKEDLNINVLECKSLLPVWMWEIPFLKYFLSIIASFRFSKKIKNKNFIILAHDPITIVAALLSKFKNKDIKIIGYFHGIFDSKKWFLLMLIIKLFVSKINVIVANSKYTQKEIKNKLKCEPKLIYPGAEFSIQKKKIKNYLLERSLKNKEKIIMSVGVYKPKGIEYGIRAFSKVVDIFPNIKYLVIGKTNEDYYKKMLKLTKKLNLQNNLIFLGELNKEEVNYCYGIADIILFPSVKESFGMVLTEAAAAKKPVITSDLPAIRETVINGKTGILVPTKNPDAIANAIVYLIKNPNKGKEMGKEAFKYVKSKYSWEKTANETLRIIQNLSKN